MGFVSWGFVVLACWLIDMSNWALKGSELPGACESFIEGVHGQKLLRGSKNVSIGRFGIGEYDENRHHIFGCMQKFWPLRGPTLIWGGLSPPVVRARDKKKPKCFFVTHTTTWCYEGRLEEGRHTVSFLSLSLSHYISWAQTQNLRTTNQRIDPN